jgi:hypothetical protein
MNDSSWMSQAGRESGARAARIQDQIRASRSPVEEFFDSHFLTFVVVLVSGSVFGCLFASDSVSPWVEMVIGTGGEPYTLEWMFNVYLKHLAGSVVGLLATMFAVGLLAAAVLMWLRKHRPALFLRRGPAAAGSVTSHG